MAVDLSSFRAFRRTMDAPDLPTFWPIKHVGATEGPGSDVYVWKEGKPKEDSFNFAPFFPFDNGGTPPYFRQRVAVDRYEAGVYFIYRAKCRKRGLPVGDFEPDPLPTPKQLQEDDD